MPKRISTKQRTATWNRIRPSELALVLPAGVGVRNGDAGHEHERRLDEVPKAAADPGDVVGVVADEFPDRDCRGSCSATFANVKPPDAIANMMKPR